MTKCGHNYSWCCPAADPNGPYRTDVKECRDTWTSPGDNPYAIGPVCASCYNYESGQTVKRCPAHMKDGQG